MAFRGLSPADGCLMMAAVLTGDLRAGAGAGHLTVGED